MTTGATTTGATTRTPLRVLLLANEFHSPHAIRIAARRAGLGILLEQAGSRDEFFARLLERAPALVLVSEDGVGNLSPREAQIYVERQMPGLPLILLGMAPGAGDSDRETVREGAAGYVPISHVERLPVMMARAVHDHEQVRREQESGSEQNRLAIEVQHAADMMRQSQKLVTIGRLAASIAHEINNPLESITNLLFLLHAEAGLNEKAHHYLTMAQHELERVTQISKQTLNFYRETPAPVRVRPQDLLEEVLVLYGRSITQKGLAVERRFESEETITVFPGEMRQVLSNLVANAVEATMPGGRLVLRVRGGRLWSDPEVTGVRITIADTGSGISREVRQRLGQPFFTTKGQGGTGLGLWVTQSIVERYGGSLQLYSSTGVERHGTVFSVFLPTNMRPQAVAGGTRSEEQAQGLSAGVEAPQAREGGRGLELINAPGRFVTRTVTDFDPPEMSGERNKVV